jgi:Leishmanolysin
MNPTNYFNTVFSGLSMTFMEAFGYYKGNFNMEEYLGWGYQSKCDAFTGACISHPNYCIPRSQQCSLDFMTRGSCEPDNYSEKCNMFKEYPASDCKYDSNKSILIGQGVKGA